MISPQVVSGFRRGWMKRPAFPLVRWGIGPCALVTDAVIGECLAEEMAFAGRAIVGYAPLDGDPMCLEEDERSLKEGGCARFFLVGQTLGAGQPGGVSDGNLQRPPIPNPDHARDGCSDHAGLRRCAPAFWNRF